MAKAIRKFSEQSPGSSGTINPDDYFDPITHIATEENFMKLLDCGIYDRKYIGYKVQLSNSVDYNNGIWVIADVGHHADQPNTYDLISQDCFYKAFSIPQIWRSSYVRTWLNTKFYNGFSNNFKNHMNNIVYDNNDNTYNDDKIILPSFAEVKGGAASFVITEGATYPIFTNNNSRKKYQTGTTSYVSWWTRSCYTETSGNVWHVGGDGDMYIDFYFSSYYIAPVLRIS